MKGRAASAASPIMWSIIVAFTLHLLAVSRVVKGQQTNFFDTPTFAHNVSHRANFCALHRMVEQGVVPRSDVLRGTTLNVGLFRYQLNKATGAIKEVNPGAGIEFLDELAIRSGFTWRGSYGILDSPGENETWSDLLEWSVDTYDMVGDWFLQTPERMKDGILFPEGWYDGSLIMVKKKPQDEYSTNDWGFLQPFTYDVWLLIIGTMVASGLVFALLDYTNAGGHKEEMELSLLGSVYSSFISFVGHLIHLPKTGSGQILSFSVCFLSLLLLSAYTANLASFLVVRNAPTIIIYDITDAIKNDLSFCVLRGSTSETTLRNEYRMARIVQKESIDETYFAVSNGECDLVLTTIGTWEKNRRNAKFNADCSLEWAGRVVKFMSAGYTMRDSVDLCSSLLRDVLGLHMVEMKLDRTFETIWRKYYDQGQTSNCIAEETSSEIDDDKNKLDISNLSGVFILHLAVITLTVGLSLFNWFYQSKSNGGKRAETSRSNHENETRAENESPLPNSDCAEGSRMSADAPPQHQKPSDFAHYTQVTEQVSRREISSPTSDPSKQRKDELRMMVVMGASILAVWVAFVLLVFL